MISLRYRRVPGWVEWLDQLEAANDFARNLWAPRNDESSFLDDMSYEDKPVDEDDEEDDGKFDFFPAPEASSSLSTASPMLTIACRPPTIRASSSRALALCLTLRFRVEYQPPARVVDSNGRRLLYKIDEQEEDDAFEASFIRMVDKMRRDLGADTDDEDDSTEDMLVDLSFAEEKANKRARRNGMFLQYGYF
ncbi:hypothetical protein PM082_000737 [Marasmius tenuissimus]|nr:hypothetical protein PM082_000737 [Marasmius tenuissimus]